jgi:putative ATP-binding cassette transporter
MNLLDLYRRESETSAIPILLVGMASGIAQSALLGIIIIAADTVSYQNLRASYFSFFVITFAVMIIGKRYALKRATVMAENILQKVRVRISDKIRNSELLFLERVGKGELYTRLAHDTNFISGSALLIINASQSVLVVVFCLAFVAILSKFATFITVLAIGIATMNYMAHQDSIAGELRETRVKEGKFFEMINQILDGFKELKMNQKKSDDYFGFFKMLAHEAKELKIKTGIIFIGELMFSQIFFYALLAVIVFIMPRFAQINSALIIRVTAAILFIIGPTNMVVGAIPFFTRANMAVAHLYGLEAQLDAVSKAYQPEGALPRRAIPAFEEITLVNVDFSYTDEQGIPLFTVGPINMAIRRGEVLFLIGGNGSGKTTLLKLLTGLYYPDTGTLSVDGLLIDQTTYQAYRELFATIFGDFHLFERLYGLDSIDYAKINDLLQVMDLEKKTKVIEGEFTNIQLSTGQRKRLAMIVALLDERPIYVFDEWAADQDPIFRQYFYEVLLRELKEQGKTVIAVSHDDRYFHFADRVLKMEYGQFVNAE